MTRLKVLLITPSLQTGGAERHVAFLAAHLKEIGVETFTLALYAAGGEEAALKNSGASYRVAEPPETERKDLLTLLSWLLRAAVRKPLSATELRHPKITNLRIRMSDSFTETELGSERAVKEAIKNFRPDVVHVHTAHCKMALAWAYELRVNKIIYSHHNILSDRHSDAEIAELAAYLRHAHALVFVSNAQRKDFLGKIPSPEKETMVIPSISGFTGKATHTARTTAPLTAGTLSNLHPLKGVIFLLDAFKILAESNAQVRLLIGGDSVWRPILEKESRRLGLGKTVTFLPGPKTPDELLAFYGQLDLFMQPSLSESLSLVCVEAMSCGLPVLGSRVGGVAEIVEDGRNGLLFSPGKPEEIAAAIDYCLKRPERRADFSKAALEKHKAVFSDGAVLEQYKKLYGS